MEWPADFQYSPLEESPLHGIEIDKGAGWTFEENKMFENALAEIDPSSPAFFENVGSRVPWKTIEDIKNHYQALIEDVGLIESGKFPIPDYEQNNVYHHLEGKKYDQIESINKDEGSPSTKNGQQRRRGVPWTEEEHQYIISHGIEQVWERRLEEHLKSNPETRPFTYSSSPFLLSTITHAPQPRFVFFLPSLHNHAIILLHNLVVLPDDHTISALLLLGSRPSLFPPPSPPLVTYYQICPS
ncbi:PREDICTED: transcription factor MYB1R1-like [Erythranthe guttata]|uniref:transcription factor MYB1R1-like n=1 Tax=Erythranthe guttata TaxID=4155 RepID=UPI00064DA22D|nr:PREDICTED: transcription factor MYB1R1-like [Erythranthe guttata]|eukprot:XP_012834988.1 PREDICTED: transcription factor MYB1R1-like [Erythranthe guttata]